MREVVIDTETTGLDSKGGHRIIEIGGVELVNHVTTGATFHRYIDPERDVDRGAFEVHGLSREFLANYPSFAEHADAFLEFIAQDDLIIHNAPFDIGFINMELGRIGRELISPERLIDTLQIARRRYPGAQASLDALCKRFEIDKSHREQHGALVDADLLALVYLELIGGRQPNLELASDPTTVRRDRIETTMINRPVRVYEVTNNELAAHAALIERITDPIWKRD